MRPFVFPCVAVTAAIAFGWNAQPIREFVQDDGKPPALDVHENYASASLLGQFRTSMSAWLWLRTDLYLHNGVELRPLSEGELNSGRKGVGTSDKELNQIRNEDLVITIVPPPKHDFRGIFGDIERETSPYKDMHHHAHNDPRAALPLFRLMTWVDPSFTTAWTTGAVTIAREGTPEATNKALVFLREGLRANPGSIDILGQLGFLEIRKKKDYLAATKYLEQARNQAFVLEHLGEDDKEALRITYIWLCLSYRDLNDRDHLLARSAEACKIFPDDKVLARIRAKALKNEPTEKSAAEEIIGER